MVHRALTDIEQNVDGKDQLKKKIWNRMQTDIGRNDPTNTSRYQASTRTQDVKTLHTRKCKLEVEKGVL